MTNEITLRKEAVRRYLAGESKASIAKALSKNRFWVTVGSSAMLRTIQKKACETVHQPPKTRIKNGLMKSSHKC